MEFTTDNKGLSKRIAKRYLQRVQGFYADVVTRLWRGYNHRLPRTLRDALIHVKLYFTTRLRRPPDVEAFDA
jgi:hypothetical protein